MENETKNLIRAGVVSAIYPERHTARVTFSDKDDVVSGELPIITIFSQNSKCYHMPSVGESVVCLMLPNSTGDGEGFIVGSYFNEVDKPNANRQEITRLDFGDGSFIEYDRKSSKLTINCTGQIIIKGKTIDLN